MEPYKDYTAYNVIEKTFNTNKNHQGNERFYQKALKQLTTNEQTDETVEKLVIIEVERRSGEDRREKNQSNRRRFDLRNKNDRRKSDAFFVKA